MVLQAVSMDSLLEYDLDSFDFQHYVWVPLQSFTLKKTKAHMLHSGQ